MLLPLSPAYLLESPDMLSVILASSVFSSYFLTIQSPHSLSLVSLIPLRSLPLLMTIRGRPCDCLSILASSQFFTFLTFHPIPTLAFIYTFGSSQVITVTNDNAWQVLRRLCLSPLVVCHCHARFKCRHLTTAMPHLDHLSA